MSDELLELAIVLVVGLGDPVAGDLGLGASAVLELERRFALPEYVRAVITPSVDAALLEQLEEASFLLVADCVLAEETPGAIFRVPLDEFERPGELPESCNEQALLTSLSLLEMMGGRPPAVLLAMQVGEREPRADLSPSVATALPALVERLVEELVKVGVPLLPRV
ncbi:MAG: hydrogenase maturation protease [Chloroflexota bacterium]